jgi:hypothetical protein
MNLDLPFPYGCDVAMRDGSRFRARASARIALAVREVAQSEAPVAIRWGARGTDPSEWAHTRLGPSGHLTPVSVDGEDPRLACLRAIRQGWPGGPSPRTPDDPDLPFVDERDPFVERVVGHARPAREAALRARAAAIVVVDDTAYVPCDEPVVVETPGGGGEIRIGRGIDWVGAHPIADIERAFPGAPRGLRLAHVHEVLLPDAIRIDRTQVTSRVVRKALIVLRKACETNSEARRQSGVAEGDLAAGRPLGAARAMSRCLSALSAEAQSHPGLREFIARTNGYLLCHLGAAA